MQGPLAVGQLAALHRVVADGREPVAARLPGEQHAASSHLLLLRQRLPGGLRAVWERRGAGSAAGTPRARTAPRHGLDPPTPLPLFSVVTTRASAASPQPLRVCAAMRKR